MENSAPNHGGTFSHKNECSFRLSGHASPAQRKPDSNSSRRSPATALQKLGRNCSIYPRFISMLKEDFRLANKFPEVSTLAGPLAQPVNRTTINNLVIRQQTTLYDKDNAIIMFTLCPFTTEAFKYIDEQDKYMHVCISC